MAQQEDAMLLSPSGMRSLGLLPQSKEKTPPFLMKIGGDEIKLEQVILQNMNAIQMTGFSMTNALDALRANSMYTALVMNLNNLVTGYLSSVKNPNVDRFMDDRKTITTKWASVQEGKVPVTLARELYRLIVRVLAEEGILNVRKHAYFGVGWKEGLEDAVKEDLEELQSHEVEDENSGE
ncbi:MAG: hypothetical protein JRN03_06125 [Nitrososphaerota archaeon]|nr:hypothetical protein [Nitrososphaerota archaeon]